jgi:hypothetical protein
MITLGHFVFPPTFPNVTLLTSVAANGSEKIKGPAVKGVPGEAKSRRPVFRGEGATGRMVAQDDRYRFVAKDAPAVFSNLERRPSDKLGRGLKIAEKKREPVDEKRESRGEGAATGPFPSPR